MLHKISNANKRWLLALVLSGGVTLGLFYLMQSLISGGKDLKRPEATENFIDFVRLKQPSNLEVKKRELPKKPEVKEEEMPKENLNVAKNEMKPQAPNNMKFDMPKLDIPLAAGEGGMAVNGGGGGSASNSDEVPLVRVEPQFPQEAAIKGITKGWVRLILDLQSDGSVSQANVIEASPRNVFEQSAIKSVLKWRYRPKIVDGRAVARKGIKIHLDFAMED
jgi:protein TonB